MRKKSEGLEGSDRLVVAALREIADENGGTLTPEAVVSAAKMKSSPLHDKFCWNDSAAAHAHRLWQARQLLRVVVMYIGPPDDRSRTQVFVSLTTDRGGAGYREIEAVLSNKEYREQLLADALEELRRFQVKYSALKELARVFAAIRRVRKVRKPV